MSTLELTGPEPTLEGIATAYKIGSFWYNFRGIFILQFSHRTPAWEIVSFFKDHYGETHLEVPVGNGTMLWMILMARRLARQDPPRVFEAVDYSPTMLGHAKRSLKRIPGIRLQRADVANLPFAESTFDTINVCNGFHCFPEPRRALKELRRVLKESGTIALNVLIDPRGTTVDLAVATQIYRWARKRLLFVQSFSVDGLLALFAEAGFDVLEQSVHGNTLHVVIAPTPSRTRGS